MSGVNKVILIGNVGKDPEVRYLEGNIPVAKFSLATNETHRNKEGVKVEQTEWHHIVLWRALAEVAEKFVRKGSLVYIEGKIRTKSWEDKDGVKKYATEIIGDTMTLLGRRPEDGTSPLSASSSSEPAKTAEPTSPAAVSAASDDLPF